MNLLIHPSIHSSTHPYILYLLIHPFTFPFIPPSNMLPICLFINPYMFIYVYLSIHPSIQTISCILFIHIFKCHIIHPFIHLLIHQALLAEHRTFLKKIKLKFLCFQMSVWIHPSTHPSLIHLFLYPSNHSHIYSPIHIYLYVYVFIHLSSTHHLSIQTIYTMYLIHTSL